MTPEFVRTPDERFAQLPDFPYAARYVDSLLGYEGLRAAYIDEGPKDATQTFLCLHGEPSWSFLYRKMIKVFLASGARVVAPDLFGFGRSDKPVDDAVYGFHFHRNMLLRLVEFLDLKNITLVVQDWGGVIGLTLPVDNKFEQRLGRLIVMNTAILTGRPAGPGFEAWKAFAASQQDLPIGALMKRSTPLLTDAEVLAYDAPFPGVRHKAGARAFPQRVMVSPDMEGVDESLAAMEFWSSRWTKPTFMAWGLADPMFPEPVMHSLRKRIAGCPEPMLIADGGHFVQEWGTPIAEAALRAFGDLVQD